MTRAGSVADEGLCFRRSGTDNPRVHAAGGRGKMLSNWGGTGIKLLRGKGEDAFCVPARTVLALCV